MDKGFQKRYEHQVKRSLSNITGIVLIILLIFSNINFYI